MKPDTQYDKRRTGTVYTVLVAMLITLLSGLASGCIPGSCNPESANFDADECKEDSLFLIYLFTLAAFGEEPAANPGTSGCRALFGCTAPYCTRVDENGSMEAGVTGWHGDLADTTSFEPQACHDETQLGFLATTPEGTSAEASSQVYQVYAFNDLIPEESRANVRRVRAQAFFTAPGIGFDHQFGLHIAAYSGDVSAFPSEGNPDTFPVDTGSYSRLELVENTLIYDFDGSEWQGLLTIMTLPPGTDFFVVFLQAYENEFNNDFGSEFFGPDPQRVDNVRVGLDTGNTRLFAVDDRAVTDEDEPVVVRVLSNDEDVDGVIDASTLAVVSSPANGSTSIGPNGSITYTPEPNTFGLDLFSYVVADDEGVFSGEADVTIEVRAVNDAPTAQPDVYQRQGAQPLSIDAPGVLANDDDIEGDALVAILVDDVDNGTLALDSDGSFTYTPDPLFLGDDTFTYRASDGSDGSSDTSVLLRQFSGTDYDLSITKTADRVLVEPSTQIIYTITVTNPGPGDAPAVTARDQLPFGFTLQTHSGGISYDTASGFWDVGNLSAGQEAELTITGLIHTTLTNVAELVDGFGDGDNPANNADSVTVTVDFNVIAPTAADDAATTPAETAVLINVLENDTDADGQLNATTILITGGPFNGSASVVADSTIQYQPATSFTGADSLRYTVEDDDGVVSNEATVRVTVGM